MPVENPMVSLAPPPQKPIFLLSPKKSLEEPQKPHLTQGFRSALTE